MRKMNSKAPAVSQKQRVSMFPSEVKKWYPGLFRGGGNPTPTPMPSVSPEPSESTLLASYCRLKS